MFLPSWAYEVVQGALPNRFQDDNISLDCYISLKPSNRSGNELFHSRTQMKRHNKFRKALSQKTGDAYLQYSPNGLVDKDFQQKDSDIHL